MRTYVGDQEALNAFEVEELAYGFEDWEPQDFRELFLGQAGESAEQRAARLEVAREVLIELQELGETDEIAWLNALYAKQLSSTVLLRNKTSSKPADWAKEAA
ncbi:hypothetical protein [Streptomyces sp. H27-C3]|uniref:hypothetical protein n=1 Tax=Streptomyces sp. H27-C3 TaxID=3046305 RepID=UPI0024BB0ECC|nr:hypothetical protein [Streptomyces sp. H27-C3]MDJ0461500.1 hypothetical protein [Streptomyces sp. H27-C3]